MDSRDIVLDTVGLFLQTEVICLPDCRLIGSTSVQAGADSILPCLPMPYNASAVHSQIELSAASLDAKDGWEEAISRLFPAPSSATSLSTSSRSTTASQSTTLADGQPSSLREALQWLHASWWEIFTPSVSGSTMLDALGLASFRGAALSLLQALPEGLLHEPDAGRASASSRLLAPAALANHRLTPWPLLALGDAATEEPASSDASSPPSADAADVTRTSVTAPAQPESSLEGLCAEIEELARLHAAPEPGNNQAHPRSFTQDPVLLASLCQMRLLSLQAALVRQGPAQLQHESLLRALSGQLRACMQAGRRWREAALLRLCGAGGDPAASAAFLHHAARVAVQPGVRLLGPLALCIVKLQVMLYAPALVLHWVLCFWQAVCSGQGASAWAVHVAYCRSMCMARLHLQDDKSLFSLAAPICRQCQASQSPSAVSMPTSYGPRGPLNGSPRQSQLAFLVQPRPMLSNWMARPCMKSQRACLHTRHRRCFLQSTGCQGTWQPPTCP